MIRALVIVASLIVAVNASAQPPTQTYQDMWNRRIDEIASLRKAAVLDLAEEVGKRVSPNLNITAFYLFAHAQNLSRELRFIEEKRTDIQVGSPAATAGSTSLLSRGAVPSIIGFAVEHGALTQTSNVTSATVRGNAVGWLDLLKTQNFIASYDDDSRLIRTLRRVSYSMTFNAAQGNSSTTSSRPDSETLTAQLKAAGQQLGSYSVRIALIDQRDPRRRENRAAIAKFASERGANLLAASAFLDPVLISPEYDRWLAETQTRLTAPGSMARRDIERVLYQRLEVLRELMAAKIPDFEEGVARFVNSLDEFESGRTKVFDRMQKQFVMAAEAVRARQSSVPAASTFRLVAEGTPLGTAWNVTGNLAFTYQESGTVLTPTPQAIGGWRDVQLAIQAERPLGKKSPCDDEQRVGTPVFSVEYLSQRIRDNAVVTFGGNEFSVTPGWIHVVQAKITLPIKGAGVKVPLSVSVANRSELLHEKTIRSQIGLTFDLSVLAAAVRQ